MSAVYLGNSPVHRHAGHADGDIVQRHGEPYYRISRYDRMTPFFISVVSGFDHWMYVSSTGGITCGRRNPSAALFPYETDDRIHDACHTAGPMTVLRIRRTGEPRLWEPFVRGANVYDVERNLYKSLAGNRLVFEEINRDLGLSFEYEWSTGETFGFIRKATLRNLADTAAGVSMLDGIRNLLPYGVNPQMQTGMSTLVDAYRQAEVDTATGAGIYTLSSIPTDRAEPSEALKATCAWSIGLDRPDVLLSADQADAFRHGDSPLPESRRCGQRGDYFVHTELAIEGGAESAWHLLADVGQDTSGLVALLQRIERGVTAAEIAKDIQDGTRRLEQRAGSADAFQLTADPLSAARHYSNTLFNVMRGGVFADGYRVSIEEFLEFARTWNAPSALELEQILEAQGSSLARESLVRIARDTGNPVLERLTLEYLPLTFSRRHGDPSRPWNAFDIDIANPGGSEKLAYQGNWRDIFQNWEALAHSYPAYLENFITKFVNASTADGYNPYRITQDGIDWEIHDPDDPWSNIGYWGDHQVNYLLKLLELERACYPGRLAAYLDREIFVYADVPYRIKGYDALLSDPRDTVEFDRVRQARTEERTRHIGSDGRLCILTDGSIARVNLLEKLLVMALVKIGNLVPGGGIWMNTQRPEWNDANNALVGFGLSMVTLCYLRRFLSLLDGLLDEHGAESYSLSVEVLDYLEGILTIVESPLAAAAGSDDRVRKKFMDRMGTVSEDYRRRVYAGLVGRKKPVRTARLKRLVENVLRILDDSIVSNRRADGLYHSYNLLHPEGDRHGVERLQEMLEGQVAVLSAGVLSAGESLELLESLRRSSMYRADQEGYTLYPPTPLPGFLEKNNISDEQVKGNPWVLNELRLDDRSFVGRDVLGRVHFNGRFRNANELRLALGRDRDMTGEPADEVCELFETVFDHRRFTGRSGAMYKYEGLGCVYWHMVSKLLLAVGETVAQVSESESAAREGLLFHYDSIKTGLGAHKSPADYGAFPMDPYSHTPAFSGVQQPGMTGQVKEDLISRFAELGVTVSDGRVRFAPGYLKREEFFESARSWDIPGTDSEQTVDLPRGALAFLFCGVPVIYRAGQRSRLLLERNGSGALEFPTPELDRKSTRSLFARDGTITRIEVVVDTRCLR